MLWNSSMKSDLQALRKNNRFLRLIISRLISNFGNGMGPVALAFGILGLEGRTGTDLSLVLVSQALPAVGLMFIGGILGDRLSRSKLMGGSDIVLSGFIFFIAYLFFTNGATTPRLMAISLVVGVLHAIWYPAFAGIPQIIVAKDELKTANSLIGIFADFGFVLGAGSGALLIAYFGTAITICVDAASFFIAGIIVVSMDLKSVRDESEPKQNMKGDFIEGFKVAKSLKWFFVIVICFSFINAAAEATYAVLGPLSFRDEAISITKAAAGWATVLASITVGMVLGGFIAMRLKFKYPLKTGMLILLTHSFFVLSLGISAPLYVVLSLGVLAGAAGQIFYVNWMTILHTLIDPRQLSRISSFDIFGSYFLYPMAIASAGPLADHIGAKSALIYSSGLMFVFIVASLCFPSMRKLRLPTKTEVLPE